MVTYRMASLRDIDGDVSNGVVWFEWFDDLRDAVSVLWPSLPSHEKARFMRHLKPWYDVHRFRIPPQTEVIVEQAMELGIVNRVIPHENFEQEALQYCAELAAGPTKAIGRMKANLVFAETASLSETMLQEARNLTLGRMDADHKEAAQAFVEKREPVFKGR